MTRAERLYAFLGGATTGVVGLLGIYAVTIRVPRPRPLRRHP